LKINSIIKHKGELKMVDQINAYSQIKMKLNETLSGERLNDALNFVDYLHESGRTCELNENHPSAVFKLADEYSCLVMYQECNDNSMGIWFILCWRNNRDVYEHESYSIDNNLKEFAQNNIKNCFDCGGCRSQGGEPTRRSVFGKEYDNVCNDVFHFYSPEGENLKNVIKLMELQKCIIVDNNA